MLAASQALDDAEVPEADRVLTVTPATYALLKQAVEFDHTEIGAEMRARGVVAVLDGAAVVKVPAVRLPENSALCCATRPPLWPRSSWKISAFTTTRRFQAVRS